MKEAAALGAACKDAASYKGDVIVERYVKGREIQVAVLDGKALGAIEVVPASEFYDYDAKYASTATQYFYPARLPEAHLRRVLEAAEIAHRSLGCAGVTRTDFIVTDRRDALRARDEHAPRHDRTLAGAEDRRRQWALVCRAVRAAAGGRGAAGVRGSTAGKRSGAALPKSIVGETGRPRPLFTSRAVAPTS